MSMTSLTLDASDPFEAKLIEMALLNKQKRADYAADDNPFSNFEESAAQTNTSPTMTCEVLIATKQSRLRRLMSTGKDPQNESVRDTILDRAVYSVIALALYDKQISNYPYSTRGSHLSNATVLPRSGTKDKD
jgi:hypothetical protein